MDSQKKVLLIDDDTFITNIYSFELKKSGFSVFIAPNGLIGITLAKNERPDIILLDIVMPDIDGLEVLRRLRLDPENKTIKILLLTNLKDEVTINEGLSGGADGYLIKTALTPQQVAEEVIKEFAGS